MESAQMERNAVKKKRFDSVTVSLLSGAAAGTSVDTVLFPLDTIKTRLQAKEGFFKAGGFKDIYRGLSSAVIGSAPSAAVFFVTYDFLKVQIKLSLKNDSNYDTLAHMIASSGGELTACIVRVPTEIVKQRMQTSQYTSVSEALKSIWSRDGLFGFYRGYQMTIFREIPFACIQFPLYEYLKAKYGKLRERQTSPLEAAFFGSFAGGFAAALTTPLDVVKTRIMLSSVSIEGMTNRRIFPMFERIVKEEGANALFKGMVPRVFWISIGGFIFLGMYEQSRNAYISLNNLQVVFSKSLKSQPSMTSLPFAYQHVPENIVDYYSYDFTEERRIVALHEREEAQFTAELAALEVKKRKIEDEKLEKTRKLAPGYSAGGVGFLQPTKLENSNSSSNLTTVTNTSAGIDSAIQANKSNLSEDISVTLAKKIENISLDFDSKQGLAPLNPWETEEDDLTLLKQVMSTSTTSNSSPAKNENQASPPPIEQPQPQLTSFTDLLSWFPSQKLTSITNDPIALSPPHAIPAKQFSNTGITSSFANIGLSSPTSPRPSQNLATSPPKTWYPDLGSQHFETDPQQLNNVVKTEIEALSVESKKFFNDMRSMGFNEKSILKTLAQHTDEKSVLDQLLAISTLETEGFSAEEADLVLELYMPNDPNLSIRAKELIGVFRQGLEFGFEKEKVWKAVVKHHGKWDDMLEEIVG
ncbi:hypothetical protein HK096_002575 [Nowakowskiella sp. JEL0078]|nr:hypothetical protein HK096_002575 [Nowakowskiella sp. JEL0078]